MNSSVEPTQLEPVAIVGMGCLFPKAEGLGRYWANIRDRRDAITEVPATHWRPEDYWDGDPRSPDRTYARRGGFLDPVDFPALEFGIAPNNLDATDTTQLLGLLVAREALEDAGYGPARDFDRDRVSVILGVTGTLELVIPLGARLGHPIWRRALKAAGVADATAEEVVRGIADSYVGWQENSFPGLLGNVAAGRIANRLDLGGTNCVVDAACASSLGAVHLALLELASRRCDLALTGGLDTFNDIFMYMCFSKTPALSPGGEARPFDASGDGTALGEGLGVLALKRLDDARRDGDRIYAVIRGVGTSSDGKGNAVYAPSAPGQVKALRQAYELSGISPATVGLVEAHGTGTKVGDATEVAALNEVYRAEGGEGTWCALGSVKSQIGHTKAAAGAAGLIKAALALHHKVLPPTAKVTRPIEAAAPGTSPFYVNTEARPWMPAPGHPRRAAVSAFGFGGSNFHCVLEEAEAEKAAADWDGDVQVLAFSAPSRAGLLDGLDAWPAGCSWPALRAEAARSRVRFKPEDRCRLLLVVDRESTDLRRTWEDARALLATGSGSGPGRPDLNGKAIGTSSGGIYLGEGPAPGGLAMLFPGQGSQYVGMLRGLACRFPQVHATLAGSDAEPLGDGRRLADLIYPHPAFSDEARAEQERALRATDVAQPALGALELGAFRLLEEFGVGPDAVAGHSFGELSALAAAGRIDARALDALARRRGRLMADCGGAGGMLAVLAPLEQVEAVVRDERLDVVIANKNAPRQAVLSGPFAEIERAAGSFAARKVATRALPVSSAFHSRFVAEASGPFLEALRGVDFAEGRVPVFANATAAPYPDAPDDARALLAGQLARPVEFVAQVEAMHRSGLRTFLEVGPDARLSGLVGAILEGKEHATLAVDASRGRRDAVHDLADVLARLAAIGHRVLLTRWGGGEDERADPPRKPALTVKVCGANPAPRPKPKPKPETRPAPTPTPAARVQAPTATSPRVLATLADVPGPADKAHHPGRNGTHPGTPMNPTNGTPAHPPAAPSRPPVAPASPPLPLGSSDPASLAQALRTAQDNLVALQKLSEQTAHLHRQFLDGQDKAHRSFQTLLEQQQRLTYASLGLEALAPPPPPTHPRAEPFPLRASAAATEPVAPRSRRPTTEPRPVAPPRPTPPPPASASPPAPAPPAPGPGRIQEVLLEVVAEKTGYPAEMLGPEMQLDADLGIDSIKRVEILSALQERLPDAPLVKPEHLGTLRTLGQIVEFLGEDALDAPHVPAPMAALSVSPRPRPDAIQRTLFEVVAEKTGYPAEMLGPEMQLDADLGIDSIKRVEILSALQERLPDAPLVKPEHLGTLRTLGQIVEFLGQGMAPASAPSGPASRAPSLDRLQAILFEVVAEKTGYPAEMLGPEMQLDADLGIDSIKRVEILSALQERLPDAPLVKPEHLGTLRTLGQIVEFLASPADSPRPEPPSPPPTNGQGNGEVRRGPGPRAAAREAGEPRPSRGSASADQDRHARVPRTDGPRVQRLVVSSVPLDGAEGRETIAPGLGGEFWIADDGLGVAEALAARLEGLGYRPRIVRRPEIEAATAPDRLAGLVLLAARSDEDGSSIKDAFRLLRACGPGLRRAGEESGALLATVSRLDGGFGLLGLSPIAEPTSGGLAGLAKTAGHEWPEVACKAIDIDPALEGADRIAGLILDELFRRGPAEVGLCRDARTTLRLVPEALGRREGLADPLGPGDVVVIAGGARGITAEVAVALAESARPTIVLLGRSPEPGPEPDWLAPLAGEAEIKRALLARANGHATPQAIGARFREVSANREVLETLRRIEAAGARASYRSIDVRDRDALRACLETVRAGFGPIRGVIHGAGVLADRRIEDQDDAQFAAVFDTKVAGLRGLLEATAGDDLRVLVLFSSSTARFGRKGQVAYAAANEVLNKWARREARDRPGCRVASINWGPWDGGMVTPALRPLFESEGVPLIAPGEGARYLVEEIRGDRGGPVEVVVLGEPREVAETPAQAPDAPDPTLATVFERALDLASLPVLESHVLDGRPVLPMALILEWLAEAAMHRNPGLAFCGIDDLRLFKGVVLRDEDPERIRIRAGKATRDGSSYRVPVELRGTSADGREFAHARGEVVLADRLPQGHRALEERNLPPLGNGSGVLEIYRDVLFHGPALQGLNHVEGCDDSAIAAGASTAPGPSSWIDRPLRQAWLSDPLALDCAFQLMIVWCVERLGAGSLPTSLGRYRQFRRNFPEGGVRILARITESAPHRARADLEFLDADGGLVARIDGYECVIDGSLRAAFRRNQLTTVG